MLKIVFFAIFSITSYACACAWQDDLELSIIAPSNSGVRLLTEMGHNHFHVMIKNISNHKICIFREWCSYGYFSLSFEFTGTNGLTKTIQKRDIGWDKNYPDLWTLEAGESFIFDVNFTDKKEWNWFDLPKDTEFYISATFEIKQDAINQFNKINSILNNNSCKDHIWSGRIKTKQYRVYL